MAGSFRGDLRLTWWLRRRQLAPRWAFWLLLLGYDVRDRGKGDFLYVPYLLVFWGVWGLIVSFGVADFLANLLRPAGEAAAVTATLIFLTMLAVWTLLLLRRAVRRSPLVFSATDAQLLCQSPLNRSAIALSRLPGDWFFQASPWAVSALLLGFTLAEIQGLGTAEHAVQYALRGLRGMSTVTFLHLAIFCTAWAAGTYRLQEDQRRPWVRHMPLVLAGYYLLALFIAVRYSSGPAQDLTRTAWLLFQPWLTPLRAAFLDAAWLPGLMPVVIAAFLAAGIYGYVARSLNLGRAAQESLGIDSGQALSVGRESPSAARRIFAGFPPGAGWRSIVWLNARRRLRTGTLSDLLPWVFLGVISAAVVLVPLVSIRAVAVFIWVQQLSVHTTHSLRQNLARWWLYGQLPLSPGRVVPAEVAGGVLRGMLLTGIGIWAARFVMPADAPDSLALLFWLLPPVIFGIALASAYDVLRRNKEGRLLTGDVATAGYLGLALSLLAAIVPALVAAALAQITPGRPALVGGVTTGVLICFVLWSAAASAFRSVG